MGGKWIFRGGLTVTAMTTYLGAPRRLAIGWTRPHAAQGMQQLRAEVRLRLWQHHEAVCQGRSCEPGIQDAMCRAG